MAPIAMSNGTSCPKLCDLSGLMLERAEAPNMIEYTAAAIPTKMTTGLELYLTYLEKAYGGGWPEGGGGLVANRPLNMGVVAIFEALL